MKVKSGGGFRAIKYSWDKARQVGGVWKLYRALSSKNACKTCALGMGGQKGGMVNEQGSFPEFCKKSLQAIAGDMQPAIEPSFWQTHSIEELKTWTPRQLEHAGRLIQPVIARRGGTHFEPISWKDANGRIGEVLTAVKPDETFWYFSGRSSNEAGFLMQLLARVYGTNNVNNCSYYCHQASGVGLKSAIGTGTATITLEDLEAADTVFVIGGNPASNHPRLMTSLMHVRRRGGNVVVINPVRETGMVKFRIPSDPRSLFFGTKIASHYVMPHIGGDLAMIWGMIKRLAQRGQIDEAFLRAHAHGVDEMIDHAGRLTWDEIETKSGVARSQIEEIADVYAASKACVFSWTMGITHHAHGVDNVQAIVNLAMCRGMIGRPGAGMMPIRGHSNVQGIGSVGVTPKLTKQLFDNLRDKHHVTLPDAEGLDTMACMEAAAAGDIKAGIFLGGNLYGSNPDATYAASALSNLQLSVVLSTTLNTGHVHGLGEEAIILPVLARDEEPEPTTQESMFNYVRLSDGGPRRLPGPRSEIRVISDLAARIAPDRGIDWEAMSHASTLRNWIADVVPGYDKVATIDQTKQEFHIGGRTYHRPEFGTEDGKAVLHVHDLPELKGTGEAELRLMTVRSEGQFNTVVYEEEDLYRNQTRRDIVLMHPDDLRSRGLTDGQPVRVVSEAGTLEPVLATAYEDIRAGNALMYYPEANVLVPRSTDPQSRTPAFKGVVILVEPLG